MITLTNLVLDCKGDPNLPFLQAILFCCLHGVFALTALVGNLLILIAIYKTRRLQTLSNIFIASLAFADVLVGLINGPLYIAIASLRVWASNHALYKAENFMWIQTLVVTTFSLCCVTVDRYYAVTAVVRYRNIVTAGKCYAAVCLVWVLSLILASSSFFVQTNDQAAMLFFLCQLLTVTVPLLLICYCYVHIFKAARSRGRGISDHRNKSTANCERTRLEMAKHRKTALTIAIIISTFVVLFTPNFVFSVLMLNKRNSCKAILYYRYWHWGVLLVFASSACNPWVYAVRMRYFRAAIKNILCRVVRCGQVDNLNTRGKTSSTSTKTRSNRSHNRRKASCENAEEQETQPNEVRLVKFETREDK